MANDFVKNTNKFSLNGEDVSFSDIFLTIDAKEQIENNDDVYETKDDLSPSEEP